MKYPARVQMTIRLPRDTYKKATALVRKGEVASSLNELIVKTLDAVVKAKRRQEIDEAFVTALNWRGPEHDE